MEKEIIISLLVTILFFIIKMIEMKYLEKQMKPLKIIIRDAVIVFISTFTTIYLYFHFESYLNEFFCVVTDTKQLSSHSTQIFTDEPCF